MVNRDEINRWSEWRKWDLHLHTFYTTFNNKFGKNLDSYVDKILEENISVVGLTNYFNFTDQDYELKTKLFNKGVAVFLNLELRLTYTNKEDDCLDLHIIFSDKVEQSLINVFLTKLNARVGSSIKILRNINSTDDKNTAVVEFNDIKNLLNKDESLKELKDNILIGFLSRGKGNGRSSSMYESLSQECNFLIHSTDKVKNILEDRKYWLSKNKPLLNSSDAHRVIDIGSKFTWIKADPTFEGLKQIVYEPEDRVKIQELKPEGKNNYEMLDTIKFIDDSFTPNEIWINQNLTAIIGGKSTGKSILLRNIAQTIDPKEVSKRLKEVNLPEYKEEVGNFNVVWKDKQKNKKNEDTGVNKKIIYIPQSYLNRLVDKKEDKTSIDDIIKNVLEQEEDVKSVFTQLQTKNREVEKIITQNIEDLFYKESDMQVLSEGIKKIGDKKGIESEIEKLKKEISELKKKSDMTEKELKQYDELISESVKLKGIKELYQKDLNALESIKNQKIFTTPFLEDLSESLQKTLRNDFFTIKDNYQSEWNEKLNVKITAIQKDDIKNDNLISTNDQKLNPLIKKVVESESLNEKIKKSEDEEKKLKEIIIQEKNLQTLKTNYISLIKNIAENQSKFFDNFFNAKTKILEQRTITKDQDLEFGIEILFEGKSFQTNFIDDVCNLKTIGKFEKGLLQDYSRSNNSGFKEEVETIIKGILSENLTLKISYSKKEAITRLTQSWFTFDYKIKQNGDEISEMFPGKKSFVLLKLLIELDNSRCPILLDQPEDDLDNRSIYNDLVKFIKAKKKERQIIIATHNPNLVVGADSECVIVANQNGDKSKNKTYQFEYVQGALENTFLNESSNYVLEQRGIQEHVCDILEGGKIAFEQRKNKYNFN